MSVYLCEEQIVWRNEREKKLMPLTALTATLWYQQAAQIQTNESDIEKEQERHEGYKNETDRERMNE